MRIHATHFKKVAAEKGMTVEQLATAVQRDGLTGERAVSAVKNWMRGSDHPRCKSEDVGRLAEALAVEPAKIAKFTCILNYHRGSPRKAALLADMVRGKSVDTAINMLTFTTKRAAVNVKKAMNAAVSEAEQASADVTRLIVAESRVDGGPMLKRFQPKDRGRSHRILKRLSHITIALVEKA